MAHHYDSPRHGWSLLHHDVARREVDLAVVEQHIDLAADDHGVVDAGRSVHSRMTRRALAAARDVLTRGFAREILDALPVEALAEGLDETLLARLRAASGREATR